MATTTPTTNQIIQLKDMLEKTYALSSDNYYKCLIPLCYELLVNQELDLVETYLKEIPGAYVEQILPKQLIDDPLFNLSFQAFLEQLEINHLSKKINIFNKLKSSKPSSPS